MSEIEICDLVFNKGGVVSIALIISLLLVIIFSILFLIGNGKNKNKRNKKLIIKCLMFSFILFTTLLLANFLMNRFWSKSCFYDKVIVNPELKNKAY